MKPYYNHIKKSNSSYSEITNNLVKNLVNKSVNKKFSMSFDYLKYEKSY